MRSANFDIVRQVRGGLVIRDQGPWDRFPSVTNDAENVVRRLLVSGALAPDESLFYYDSENDPGEILIRDGKFAGFGPWDGDVK
jgi:hypothetical protein